MLQQIKLEGKILLQSGLHIGGADSGVKIGGIDSPVMKNPLNDKPYIPGSSLKGKMRFLLEHKKGVALLDDGEIPSYNKGKNELIPALFGHTDQNENETLPTRIIVRDSHICGAIKNFNSDKIEDENLLSPTEAQKMMQSIFSEDKPEVAINRKTGTAISPRHMERVPAGTVFQFEIILRQFEKSDNKFIKMVYEGLKLIENDCLGGFGSRGSGKIKFFDIKENGEKVDLDEKLGD